MKNINIVLLGAPGVGKGTYAKRLSEKLEIPTISTGDLIREKAKTDEEIKKNIDSGKLIDDEQVLGFLKERISKDDCKNGFILDGYPRNVQQAEDLKKVTKINKVIHYVADDETILSRLGGRLTCKECSEIYHIINIIPKKEGICDKCGGELYVREDQKEEVIKERLEIYREKTEPLIEYYEKENLLAEVNANVGMAQIDKIIGQSLDAIEGEE